MRRTDNKLRLFDLSDLMSGSKVGQSHMHSIRTSENVKLDHVSNREPVKTRVKGFVVNSIAAPF